MNKNISSRVSSVPKIMWSLASLIMCFGIAMLSQAQNVTPAGTRVLTGAFVDRDWSDTNPCGDKITYDWEWSDNKQWYGNVYPYFGKIFPEVFRPDGSKNWYSNWRQEIAQIKSQGRVPYINLEFHGELQHHNNAECWHGGGKGNDRITHNIIREILNGQHNDIIDNVAWGLKGENVPVVIDLFHEANGGWYDWSPCKHSGETWTSFRAAYQYVVNRFRAVGATNVKFGQSVWPSSGCWSDLGARPDGSHGAIVADMYVPGYMDWIGIDIYGSGTVGVFSDLMDPWYGDLSRTGLPIVIGEMSVAPGPNKINWITSFANALTSGRYPAVKAFNWFDINKKPENTNWQIDAGGAGPTFSNLMKDSHFVGGFGTYEVKNKANSQCLDIAGGSVSDSAKAQTYACNGTAAQTFTLTDLGNYKMELRALNSGKCIDVAGASTADGAQIQQYACNASSAQVWTVNIVNWSTMEVELRANNSNKCMDVDNGVGPKVQQWSCTAGAAQRFFLKKR